MIDDETRHRAKEYVDGFSEATAGDPKPPAPDLEPMEETRMARPAISGIDDDAKQFSDAFFSMTDVSEKPGDKMLAADKPESEKLGAPMGKPAAPESKPETFAQAWKKARAAGVKSFDWAGKPGVKFSTENKAEAAARKAAKAKPVAQPAAPTPQELEKQVPKQEKKPSIYANSFLHQAVDSVKAKLDDDSQVGKAKFHANGRPNLTAR
jgi:hypothetical protein